MRIGIVGPTWPDSFAANIIDALRAMGHTRPQREDRRRGGGARV